MSLPGYNEKNNTMEQTMTNGFTPFGQAMPVMLVQTTGTGNTAPMKDDKDYVKWLKRELKEARKKPEDKKKEDDKKKAETIFSKLEFWCALILLGMPVGTMEYLFFINIGKVMRSAFN